MARPCSLYPQHSAEPLVLTPHVWLDPELTEEKEPPGGVDWPSWLNPQHSTEPSVFNPQLWASPEVTEAKAFAGDRAEAGVDSTVTAGAEVGVLVGAGAVAVGPGVGAGLSLQAPMTAATAKTARAGSQGIRTEIRSFRLSPVMSCRVGITGRETAAACSSVSRLARRPTVTGCVRHPSLAGAKSHYWIVISDCPGLSAIPTIAPRSGRNRLRCRRGNAWCYQTSPLA